LDLSSCKQYASSFALQFIAFSLPRPLVVGSQSPGHVRSPALVSTGELLSNLVDDPLPISPPALAMA
jgi:hypothetical protein